MPLHSVYQNFSAGSEPPLNLPGEDRLLAVQGQVVDVLRHDDLREQAGCYSRLRHRSDGPGRFGELRIAGRLLARAVGIRRPGDHADEDQRRRVVEPFAECLDDLLPHSRAARAGLLGFGQVDLLPLPRKIRRVQLAAVPLPLRHLLFGRCGDRFGCRRRSRFGFGAVEEARAFDTLPAAAEGHLHELRDVGLLLLDRAAKLLTAFWATRPLAAPLSGPLGSFMMSLSTRTFFPRRRSRRLHGSGHPDPDFTSIAFTAAAATPTGGTSRCRRC